MKQKTVIKTLYYADDGREFNSADTCKRYESETLINRLYLNNKIDDKDAESLINYIDLIKGQFDVIKDPEIRVDKVKRMLEYMQKKIKETIISEDEN